MLQIVFGYDKFKMSKKLTKPKGEKMQVRIDEVKKLIKQKYRNNQAFFAEEIEIDRSYLNQLLNKKINNKSPKICNAIISYCERKGIDYKKYIFFNSKS